MSTRANVLIVTPEGNIQQYYHHCDGYFSGVGEELRKTFILAIGTRTISTSDNTDSLYTIFTSLLEENSEYEKEELMSQNDSIQIHGDIEYCYLLDFSKSVTYLYGCHAWDLSNKVGTNAELLQYICQTQHTLPLDKPVVD